MAVDAGILDADDTTDLGAARKTREPESPTATQDSHRTVDAEHPWLGLASFTEETRAYFYGRDQEVAELSRRVQRKLLTILFGQSGLGKTSILRAGIVPKLRPAGYCPVYVRIDYSSESPPPAEQIKEAIFRATEAHGEWTQAGIAAEGESLWEFLHHRDDVLKDGNGKTVVPLLIFDQFEEIFTLAQADDEGRRRAAQFIEDLADLVENRPPKALEAKLDSDDTLSERFDFARADYRILIALREDYLAHLEGVKGAMPSITQNRMRLAPMTGQQALSAVTRPGGKLVSQEVAESIVRFIAGGSEIPNAEVEPSLLSLICRELNNARIAQGRNEISVDLLAGSNETILAEFYERALADQPAAVRRFIEDEMLTDSGYRESLAEERVRKAFNAAGATADALAKLVDRRLLRIEERLDLRRVELTHDVLCNVVAASRDMRHEREARDEAERQLAAQKAREAATRRALVRARQVAAVCGVLAIGAIASAIFGYQNMKRAQEAEAKALQTRQTAETARGEAEKLMVYLLDDFTRELEPTGRLDIVAELAKRALEYYRGLPPVLRTPDTERNRALALVRYGAVLRSQTKFDAALPLLEEATEVFRRLRAEGDSSEATVLGLAGAMSYRASILGGQLKLPESVTMGEAGLAVLRPLAAMPNPSRAVLRQQGDLLVNHGYNTLRSGAPDGAVIHLQEAQHVFRKLGAPELTDLSVAASYASAGGWLGVALGEVEKWREARAKFEEAIAVAGRVLDVMPGHTRALHTKGLSLGQLGAMEAEDYRVLRAAALAREQEQVQEGLLKIDPTSGSSLNNLAVARSASSFFLRRAGRVEEACDKMRAATAIGKRLAIPSSFTARNLSFWNTVLAECEAERGDPKAAAAALAQSDQLVERNIKPTSSEFQTSLARQWRDNAQAWVLLAAGDVAGALKHARHSLVAADALEPPNKPAGDFKQRVRLRMLLAIATAEYRVGNLAAAEVAARAALEVWQPLPRRDTFGNLGSEQQGAAIKTILAQAIARQGRLGEAGEVLRPALKFHRELHARQREDRQQHSEFAHALYVSALIEVDQRSARLAEASAILDSLPPEMNRSKSGLVLRGWIADETAKLR